MAQDGLTARLTKSGIPVLTVHYSADEYKDPRTPAGKQWVEEVSQGYPLGMQDPGWQKEMEIQYGAMGGQLLFQLWEHYKPFVSIPPFAIAQEPGVKFYGTYDHGNKHKAAYLVHAVLPDGRKFTVWEFAESNVSVPAMAEIIKGHDVTLSYDGRTFKGNPYAGKELLKVCDPHLFEKRGRWSNDPFESTGDLFRDKYGVSFQKGHTGGQLMVASWLIGDLWAHPEQPKYQIFNTCRQLLYELPRLRYQQITSAQAKTKNAPEKLVDKDDDAFDSMCQFLRLFPSTVARKTPKSIVGTFAWHAAKLKTRSPLQNVYVRL
jgi:hypothetical protein